MCQSLVISRTEWKLVLREPAPGLLGVGAGVDRFAAEIDAAFEQLAAAADAPREVGLGHRRVGAGDQQALGLAVAQHVDRMLDPPAAAGQDDRGVGRLARRPAPACRA